MQLKDYYHILELPPSASGDEVKKAFRRLAHQYHPDKRNNDPYAAARFAAIKEAYETLSHPQKKEYYLQQRWYAQSMGKRTREEPVTPVAVLKQSLELNRYVSRLDVHRMDHQGLFDHIQLLLPDSTIETLNAFNEQNINQEIVWLLLNSIHLLPYQLALRVAGRLEKIDTDDNTKDKIKRFVRRQRQIAYWEKRKTWLILLVALLICLAIFLVSSN